MPRGERTAAMWNDPARREVRIHAMRRHRAKSSNYSPEKYAHLDKLTVAERAYIAGFLDGEGHIGLARRKVVVTFTNTDRAVLEWMNALVGGFIAGHVHSGPPRKPTYRLVLSHCNAIELILRVRPYLRINSGQADVVVEFWRNRFVSWGGYEGAKASITHLNRRGVAA